MRVVPTATIAPRPRDSVSDLPRGTAYRRTPFETPGSTLLCGLALTAILFLLLKLHLMG